MLLELPDLRPEDFTHRYDLPDSVDSTIPTSTRPDEPTAHWTARGILAETCDRLTGHPISLGVREQRRSTVLTATVLLDLDTDPTGEDPRDILTVRVQLSRSTGHWVLTLNRAVIGEGVLLPSPRWLADRVETAYHEGY